MQAQLPSVEELRARMAHAPLRALNRNTFYRDSPVAAYALHATGPLYGLNFGGRYSPKNTFPVLYFAADRLQAQLETAHHLNRYLPSEPVDQVRMLHTALSSMSVTKLRSIMEEMAESDNGYDETEALSEFLSVPIVQKLFAEDPARLQVFLSLGPHLETPLRCLLDSSRLTISVNITARGVLDLNNEETLAKLEVGHGDLLFPTEQWEQATSDNYTLTQRIGLAAADAPGIDGILVPTALSKAMRSDLVIHPVNLILFMDEKNSHLPRSTSVKIDVEDEFIKLSDLIWTHRPQWLLDSLSEHAPDFARALKRTENRSY